ncbi:hypothetical protein KSP40_PGU013945 [Platanthera guangdongensis]|uniref:Uncharacterized protein n=1 Tax=Platanthera guangdongensis TaxID=2320717 RepID=A0ABR2MCF9_9ASPA
MLWSEHKVIEDHIVPQPKECYGNSFSKFGRCGKNQRHEDDFNAISSAVETKNARLSYNVKYSSGININQELNYSTINMDTWPDLPNLSMTFVGGFNDGDSGVTGLVSDVVDACDTPSLGRFMGGYSRSSLFGNEMIDNAYTFLTASADLVSSTSRSIPVPSGKQQLKPTYLDFSKHRKAGAVNKPSTMTPQEKIEKLRRRQQMQAMRAIQKQREQYDHQISGSDVTEHSQKLPSSDASSVAEQDQSQMISSSLDDHLAEEAIYYQLQDAMRKLDNNVRLSIRDSLYRLARSAMERQNASDGSCTNKSSNEEDEICADEESIKDRYFRPPDSEAVTNPIDRIVAHLLFHNPSPMPIIDRDISMAISM